MITKMIHHTRKLLTLEKINQIRKENSLQRIKHGMVLCLKCEGEFYSYNKIHERICAKCKLTPNYIAN